MRLGMRPPCSPFKFARSQASCTSPRSSAPGSERMLSNIELFLPLFTSFLADFELMPTQGIHYPSNIQRPCRFAQLQGAPPTAAGSSFQMVGSRPVPSRSLGLWLSPAMGRCLVFQPGESYGKLIIRRYPKVLEGFQSWPRTLRLRDSCQGHCRNRKPCTPTDNKNKPVPSRDQIRLVVRDIEPSLEFHTDSRCFPNPCDNFPNPCDNCPILHSQTTTIWPWHQLPHSARRALSTNTSPWSHGHHEWCCQQGTPDDSNFIWTKVTHLHRFYREAEKNARKGLLETVSALWKRGISNWIWICWALKLDAEVNTAIPVESREPSSLMEPKPLCVNWGNDHGFSPPMSSKPCWESYMGSPMKPAWQRLATVGSNWPIPTFSTLSEAAWSTAKISKFPAMLGPLAVPMVCFQAMEWANESQDCQDLRIFTSLFCESYQLFMRVPNLEEQKSPKTGAKTVSSETTIIHCDQCSAWCAAFLDSCVLWFINRGSGTIPYIPCISELALERWPWQLWHCKEPTGFAIWLHLLDPSGLHCTSVRSRTSRFHMAASPAHPTQGGTGGTGGTVELWNCCEYGYHWYHWYHWYHLSLVGAFFAFRTSTSPSCWMPYESSEPTATGGRCGRSSEPTATQPVVFCDEKNESEKRHHIYIPQFMISKRQETLS